MKKHKESTVTNPSIRIEVAFASPSKQRVLKLEVPANTSARRAVELSDLSSSFPNFDLSNATIGVFGKAVPDDHLLSDQDRVEIYRPLHQSPTDARRQRVKAAKKTISR